MVAKQIADPRFLPDPADIPCKWTKNNVIMAASDKWERQPVPGRGEDNYVGLVGAMWWEGLGFGWGYENWWGMAAKMYSTSGLLSRERHSRPLTEHILWECLPAGMHSAPGRFQGKLLLFLIDTYQSPFCSNTSKNKPFRSSLYYIPVSSNKQQTFTFHFTS